MDPSAIYTAVKDRYSATALAPSNPSYSATVAQAFGYSAEELASIPAEANLGVSCGNPIALANLKEGKTVIDLGCGAGFDCFLAARKVGPQGKVIGVDMNEDMLAKARKNASQTSHTNTTFLLSPITSIPLPSHTADIVISNCVINLVPHASKPLVFAEMHRLLRPGGRLAISDILAKKPLPEEMKRNVALYVGCVAGASLKGEYEVWLKEVGFESVEVVDAEVDLNVYTQGDLGAICCGAEMKEVREEKEKVRESKGCCGGGVEKKDGGVVEGMKTNWRDVDLNEWAGSYKIFAVKGA